ncbi:hypothetical protein COT72_03875 [archaeon CG10_big_fil_rev_8_21_14_0_10_43_11]|nr:MAG: hypothetical protein COT72_03875 [archaeon CG10_big_fil_rev_8_21_14_0_10_43_11]
MSKLPLLSARVFFKVLSKLGFEKIRQEGSHVFFRHPDGRTTVVPNYPREKLNRGLLNKIVKKDLEITRDDLMKHV